MSGDEWYVLEASRAVNQAIGRVIRHKNDYGAILLCDNRFNNPRQKNQLSKWLQGHLNEAQHSNFGPLIGEVTRFFRNAERTLPQPELRKIDSMDMMHTPNIKVTSIPTDDTISRIFGTIFPKNSFAEQTM